jgi:hypothetical protein
MNDCRIRQTNYCNSGQISERKFMRKWIKENCNGNGERGKDESKVEIRGMG